MILYDLLPRIPRQAIIEICDSILGIPKDYLS